MSAISRGDSQEGRDHQRLFSRSASDPTRADITEHLAAERAQAELAIVESSNDAIVSTTLDGVIVSWNRAAEKIYGYSALEVIGRSIMILAPPEEHDGIRKILARIKRGESIEHLETTRLRKDGRLISVSLTISPIKNSQGEISGASAIARDVTEQQRAEQALRVSEQRFRELAENIREVFWLSDPENTQMFYVSPAYETVWGRSCSSLYLAPKSWLEAVHLEDKRQVLAAVGSQPCREPHDFTYRIVRPDGSIRWIRDRGFPVRNECGEVVRFAGLADDITETKQAEQALQRASRQLRNLSRRRVQVEEEERRHLARELHDHVGQLITAGSLNLQLLRSTRGRRATTGKLDETIAIFDQVLQQVRQISFDIRPPVLDDIGLAPAMRWMFDDATNRAGLASEFFADPNLKRGDVESETSCYRVAQEAVLNVVRHAHARKVWMELRNEGDALQLIVRDDGIGFDVAAAGKRVGRDRLGLVGMHERATALGGKFECESTPDRGTEVRAFFPVSSELDRIELM
jgi:PAS domain S-box-containing protein